MMNMKSVTEMSEAFRIERKVTALLLFNSAIEIISN